MSQIPEPLYVKESEKHNTSDWIIAYQYRHSEDISDLNDDELVEYVPQYRIQEAVCHIERFAERISKDGRVELSDLMQYLKRIEKYDAWTWEEEL